MASWQKGVGGALGGAAAGTAIAPGIGTVIGGLLGGVSSLFGGDDGEADYQRQMQLYQELLKNYHGPEEDPEYMKQLAGMGTAANGGLTPADRASMLEAYTGASDFAHGREGAIGQQQMMRGGGVASSGQQAVLQAQAAQQGAQRYQMAGTQAAGNASNRALQARMAYMDQIQRNKASLNNYRLSAAGKLGDSMGNMANYKGASAAANNEALTNGIDTAAQVGMYYGNRRQPSEGGSYTGGGSSTPDYRDYYSSVGQY